MASRDFYNGPQTLTAGLIHLYGLFRVGDPVAGADVLLEKIVGHGFEVRMGAGGAAAGIVGLELDDGYLKISNAIIQGASQDIPPQVVVHAHAQFIANTNEMHFCSMRYSATAGTATDPAIKKPVEFVYHDTTSLLLPSAIPAGLLFQVSVVLANSQTSIDQ